MKLRPITGADRALAHGDRLTRAIGDTVKPRRRTHFKFGKLEVVVVETSGEPTTVYLTDGKQARTSSRRQRPSWPRQPPLSSRSCRTHPSRGSDEEVPRHGRAARHGPPARLLAGRRRGRRPRLPAVGLGRHRAPASWEGSVMKQRKGKQLPFLRRASGGGRRRAADRRGGHGQPDRRRRGPGDAGVRSPA